jgi:hypothetical protein
MKDKKILRILNLEGGGCKGYMYCCLLAKLEKKTGKKCHEIFDLIGGTSIGAIVAALLASDKTAQECMNFFIEDAPIIFKRKWYNQKWWNPFGFFYPMYSDKVIEKLLKEKFDNKTLKDCKTEILIPAFNLTTDEPFFFKSYEGDNTLLWKAVRASSSAQFYFPAFRDGNNVFWDGGDTNSNNPGMCTYADAIKLKYKVKNMRILTLHCGQYPQRWNPLRFIHCGALMNIIRTVSVMFESGSQETDYQLKQIFGKNYLSINPTVKENFSLAKFSDKQIKVGEEWVKNYYSDMEKFVLSD